jgi:hypothetical protein
VAATSNQATDGEALRRRLETIDAVERAVVEGPPWKVYLICKSGAAAQPADSAARSVLTEAGLDASGAEVHVSMLSPAAPERRVRLAAVRLTHPTARSAAATVLLEWDGTEHSGEAEGEGGPVGDLRVAGIATIRALRAVQPELPPLQIIGIRMLRVFDNDLVVVLVGIGGSVGQSLLGTSLVTSDLPLTVARAVLNALNRMLGNYLSPSG